MDIPSTLDDTRVLSPSSLSAHIRSDVKSTRDGEGPTCWTRRVGRETQSRGSRYCTWSTGPSRIVSRTVKTLWIFSLDLFLVESASLRSWFV